MNAQHDKNSVRSVQRVSEQVLQGSIVANDFFRTQIRRTLRLLQAGRCLGNWQCDNGLSIIWDPP